MEPPPTDPKVIEIALRHYKALLRAQKAYYDRKHPMETRRPRGRPRKVVAGEGSAGEGPAAAPAENPV